ncbi:MAG TPA: hypothetical protein VE093_29615 [Polyangiaceae bacterium]|nr:hypothetical protein [Polyangiaceae bacterium]
MRCRRFSWCGLGVLIALLAAPVESLCAEPSEAKEEEEETKPQSMWRYTRFPDQIPPEEPPPVRERGARDGVVIAGSAVVLVGSVMAVSGFLAAASEQAREARISAQFEVTEGLGFCSRRENYEFCQTVDTKIDFANLFVFGGFVGLVMGAVGGGLIIRELMGSPAPKTEPQAAVVVMPGRAGLWVIGSF